MKKRNILAVVLMCIMMCVLTACGSTKVQYDLTLQDNLAYSVGGNLNTGEYQSQYRDKVFKLRGVIQSSGDDYHRIVTSDGCCNFTMEVRLANDELKWPSKMNKAYTIIATYTRETISGNSSFYFAINEFC